MNILFVITGLNIGGAERALYSCIVGLRAKNKQCKVVSLYGNGYWSDELIKIGVPVYSLGLGTRKNIFRGCFDTLSMLLTEQFDVVQGWMYHGNIVAIVFKILFNHSAVLAWGVRQTFYQKSLEKPLTRVVIFLCAKLSKFTDIIIYNSELSLKQHNKYGFDKKNASYLPNSYDVRSVKRNGKKNQFIRKSLGCQKNELLIGHVARFHPMKGHQTFIDAAKLVLKVSTNTHFILIGRGLISQKNRLLSSISRSQHSNFHFFDELAEVYEYFQSFDIFCLTSSWGEGFPNVIAEAMLLEVPCVTTDVGDAKKILNDKKYTVPINSPDRLSRAILDLIDAGPAKRKKIGKFNRKIIIERYEQENVTRLLCNRYENLINIKRSRDAV